MKNFIQPGNVITHIAAAIITSGEVIVMGSLLGVSSGKAAIGEEVEVALEGVFKLGKTAAEIYTQGQPLYYNAGTKLVTDDDNAGANKLVGHAFKAAAGADAFAYVRLDN